jgi:predicted KAP-like P-loop ATPase
LLSKGGDQAAFSAGLLDLARQFRADGRTRVSGFLERLEDYTTDEIPLEHIEPIILSFFDVGDGLVIPQDERKGLLGYGNDVRIGQVRQQLLGRLGPAQQFAILQRAFEQGHAIYLMWRMVGTLRGQQGKPEGRQPEPESDWMVSVGELEALEERLVARTREAANNGSLITTPHLSTLLCFWREKGGSGDAKGWAEKTTIADSGLMLFLEGFLQRVTSIGIDEIVSRSQDTLDPEQLKPYIDPDTIAGRAEGLTANKELTPRQCRVLEAFIRGYKLRKRGIDPNNPLQMHT